jgi:hypothetical protein
MPAAIQGGRYDARMSAGPGNADTVGLLRAWRAGDGQALDRLVVRELPWLTSLVQRRLGALLRARHDTEDIVQETSPRSRPRARSSSRARRGCTPVIAATSRS